MRTHERSDAVACRLPTVLGLRTRTHDDGNPDYALRPVIRINRFQAQTFCAWSSKRLPTEAE
jgi:formylglycine-generating enzyme required for sulfatase activity